MKRIYLLLLVISILFLASCNREENDKLKELSQDKSLMSMTESVYNIDTVILKKNSSYSFYELCENLGIDYMKSINGYHYTVINTSDGYVMIYSDYTDKALMRVISFSSDSDLSRVSQLQNGMTLEDVNKADPNGQYDFLSTSYSYAPRYSFHFFETGECYYIEYGNDDVGTIVNIIPFTI